MIFLPDNDKMELTCNKLKNERKQGGNCMKKGLKILTAFLLSVTMLAGCGKGKESTEKGKTGEKTETNEKTGAAKDGGILRVGLSANVVQLDPVKYTAVYESNVMRSIYDTLVTYNHDLTKIVPSLAKEWKISDDMMTYTFKLRDDVHFQKGKYQDGRKLTAEDIKYSLMRSLNKSAMKRLRYVKEIEVLSDTEVKIVLEKPYAPFLVMLTDAGNSIVCKEEVEGHGDNYTRNPVGTGPFSFDSWQADSYITLKRNEKYYGNKPHLDGLKFSFITDSNMMGNALQSGDIDLATNVQGTNIQAIKANDKLEMQQIQGLSIGYFSFNVNYEPFKNLKVRQAMNLALNREDLTKGIYKFGEAKPGYLPIPRASWGYSEEAEKTVKDMSGGTPEKIEEAKKLMKEAGYENGFNVELYCSNSRVNAATVMQAQMEKIGVKIAIKPLEWGAFSDTVSKGNAQSYIMGWTWYPDPDFFLFQMTHSNQIGALGNGGQFKNAEVDKLLDEATTKTVDQKERAKIYADALKVIAKELPHLDLYDQDIITATNKKVKGFTPKADQSLVFVSEEKNVWMDK